MPILSNVRAMKAALWPYTYKRRSLPGPGSMNLAFQNEALPYYTPIGAGIANKRTLVFNMGTAYMEPHLVGWADSGGIPSGIFKTLALIVPQQPAQPQAVYITTPQGS